MSANAEIAYIEGEAAAASEQCPVRPLAPHREYWISVGCIVLTLIASGFVALELGAVWLELARAGHWGSLAGHSLFLLIVAFLIYGGLVYQFTRYGYLKRTRAHRPASPEALEAFHDGEAPSLTILVPSYKEDESVVAKTLLSAALQDYPKRRVVLLIDDPPHPEKHQDAADLAAARSLPARLHSRLQGPAARFAAQRAAYEARAATGALDRAREGARLAALYREAADWFERQIQAHPRVDHTDTLFVEQVLGFHRARLRARAASLQGSAPPAPELRRHYHRLAALFAVEITSFERKRYVNLSHEPNKAMNLNSYIGLVGKPLRERQDAAGLHLEEAPAGAATLQVPDTDYFITLDADSLLVPDYAPRLIHLMEQPEHARTGVAQTPYSAIPGAPGTLERIAGATTDIQFIIHQGFTAYDATYWVGANALLRKTALADIAVTETERGFPVTRFIQDRTVIEDTESSVDLVARGWRLHNYPARLAYSATPPDFGALLIQRRRWANGGLIILPKLLRYLRGARPGEAFLRFHYLASIAAVNLGLLILLAVPFTESLRSLWLPLSAAPYFLLYGRDLRLLGYRPGDLLRVYALNLLLIPVNLGGVFKSLQQAWSRAKIPFGRTPKVAGRTAAAPLYILAAYALLAHWLLGAGVDFAAGRWPHGLFALFNAAFLLYAVLAFIGLRESREDLAAGLRARWPAWLPGGAPRSAVSPAPGLQHERPPAWPVRRADDAGAGFASDVLSARRGDDRFFVERAAGEDAGSGWFFRIREGKPLGPFPTREQAKRACAEFLRSATASPLSSTPIMASR